MSEVPDFSSRCEGREKPLPPSHGGDRGRSRVDGGSRLGKGCAREDRIPNRLNGWQQSLLGVRTVIVVMKRGNARGAKDGRKANGGNP